MKTVSNPHGEIELLDPAPDLLQAIRSILPFGVIPLVPPQQDADFGLVMQCGEQQLSAVSSSLWIRTSEQRLPCSRPTASSSPLP